MFSTTVFKISTFSIIEYILKRWWTLKQSKFKTEHSVRGSVIMKIMAVKCPTCTCLDINAHCRFSFSAQPLHLSLVVEIYRFPHYNGTNGSLLLKKSPEERYSIVRKQCSLKVSVNRTIQPCLYLLSDESIVTKQSRVHVASCSAWSYMCKRCGYTNT